MPTSSLRRTFAAVRSSEELRAAAASVVLFLAAVAVETLTSKTWAIPLYIVCYVTGGWAPGRDGLAVLRQRTLDVDILMVVAAVAAAAIGEWFDGALLIVIFAKSGALEHFVTTRTEQSVRALMELAPDQATLLDEAGGERVVAAASLAPGQHVLVRPGERVPADGRIVTGETDIDQSSLTGEAVPVARRAGDDVFAGTINGTGAVTVEVTRAAGESVLARIAALVEEATSQKSRIDMTIERFEQRYSVGVVIATILWLAVPTAVLGWAWEETLVRAMSFMIVASPCAVVLATMPPLLSAIAVSGRRGVLVRSAAVMERLGAVDTFVFDKTGTLTVGDLTLNTVEPVGDWDEADVLALAAATEAGSEHPVGRAVLAAARARRLALPGVAHFEALPGRGVQAEVEGRRVRIGSRILLGRWFAELESVIEPLEADGATVVVVEVDGVPAGVLGVTDSVRAESGLALAALRAVGVDHLAMLTGDRPAAAATVAARVGLSRADVRSELLPEGKLAEVQRLQAQGRTVAFVGDGVNDAPALAASDVGIAMGRQGTDAALETADVVLVADELGRLPRLLEVSRRANAMVKANLILAVSAITVLVALDVVGRLPLPLAVAGHEGSTVLVGLNSLRLLRAWPADPARASRRAGRGGDPRDVGTAGGEAAGVGRADAAIATAGGASYRR